MKKTNLICQKYEDLEFSQIIDNLVLDVYTMMPSSGTFPFTIIQVTRTELSGLAIEPTLNSSSQILVMKRTDFDHSALTDYTMRSKEYIQIRSEIQNSFLKSYLLKYQDDVAITTWSEQITSLAIGILTQLARCNGITLKMAETDPAELDIRFRLPSRNLHAYQLFDISPLR